MADTAVRPTSGPLMAEALTRDYMRELAIDAMPSELARSIAGSVSKR